MPETPPAHSFGGRRSLLARSTGAAPPPPEFSGSILPPTRPATALSRGTAAAPPRAPAFAATADDLPSSVAVITLALYMAAVSSVSSQIAGVYMGLSVPIIGGAFALAALAYLLAGDQLSFFSTRFAVPWFALLVWWYAAAVFGMYPTGSLKILNPYAARIHILPLLFMGIAKNARAVRVVMYGLACGYVLVLFYCYRFGRFEYDRFIIPDTALANGNDLALHLVFGACFMLILLRRLILTRVLWALTTPVVAYYVLKTGSRSNMLTLVFLFAAALFVLPMRHRVKLLLGGAVIALAIVPLLPRDTMNRLLTFTTIKRDVSSYQELDYAKGAVGSAEARSRLQRRAVELTIANPLLGVGPSMFPNAVDELVRQTERRKSGWQVSHNSYLQVSSESGIPGLVFYVWVIFLCAKLNYRAYKDGLKAGISDMSLQSLCLLAATGAYAFGVLFSSIAYDYHLAVIVGLTGANFRAWKQASAPSAAAAPLAAARPRFS